MNVRISLTTDESAHMLLDVLDEERGGSEIVHREVKESLYLLVVEIHGNEVGHPRLCHHVSDQFGCDAASLPHLAVLAVRQIGHHANHLLGRGSLSSITGDEHLHDGVVDSNGVTFLPRVTSLNDEDIFASNRLHDFNRCLCANSVEQLHQASYCAMPPSKQVL